MLLKRINIRFYQKLFSGSKAVTCGQTDERTGIYGRANRRIFANFSLLRGQREPWEMAEMCRKIIIFFRESEIIPLLYDTSLA
jgi:hypothetical protein